MELKKERQVPRCIFKHKWSVIVFDLDLQIVLGLAVGIKEDTCPPLHPTLHFTEELEKHPVCLFLDPRVYI